MNDQLEAILKQAIAAMERYLNQEIAFECRSTTLNKNQFLELALMVKKQIVFREEMFPKILSPGPMWRILVEIYIAESQKVRISITDAAIVANIAITTSLRYTNILEDENFIFRVQDGSDKRRNWLNLTDRGVSAVEDVLRNLAASMEGFSKHIGQSGV